ncbi:MAG: hypothetical protein U9N49_00535, partial [Campylobacterota bacterium]|nr:hypothetical protein [Campylobacterota bacterium]
LIHRTDGNLDEIGIAQIENIEFTDIPTETMLIHKTDGTTYEIETILISNITFNEVSSIEDTAELISSIPIRFLKNHPNPFNPSTTISFELNEAGFRSNIPYKINRFHTNFPQDTLNLGYGDCDDKSNLLISMLHILNIEAYFVLVPKHIFIVVPLENIWDRKALYIDGKAHYILETTAKDSPIGFPLQYRLSQIDAIIDPFENQKVLYSKLEYR